MNEIEKAIEDIKNNRYTDHVIARKSIDLAISALEKQIPKPIVGIKAQLQNRYCPSCNEWMFFDKYGQAKYCPTCGQKLDWSVEE